ncbi:hypothetical protein Tco_0353011 [Tanacetum coccineum]
MSSADAEAVIAISCNLVQHSRTKHIDVRYHFITESLYRKIGLSICQTIGMRCMTPDELEFLAIELLDPSNIKFEDGNPAWATSYKILVGDFAQFLYELKLFDNWISILVTVNELRLNQKDSKLSDSLYRVVCFETFRIRRRWLQPYSSEVGFINHMLILKLSKSIVQHQDG